MEAYPHMWEVNTSLAKLIADYSDLEDGARVDEASLQPKLREYSSIKWLIFTMQVFMFPWYVR